MKWQTVKLGDVADIITGKTPSKKQKKYWNGHIPFITPVELNNEQNLKQASRFVTDEGAQLGTILPPQSILVCCIGSLGKIGINSEGIITNQQINSLVCRPELLYFKYAFYALSKLKPEMEQIAPATTVKIINKTLFSGLKIPLPPLEEQKRIAAILDQAALLIEQQKKALTECDEFLKASFLSMFGDPVTNPKNWEKKKLGELGSLDRGKSKHRPRNAPELLGGKYPLIQTGEVANSNGYIKTYTQTYSEIGLAQSKMWKTGTLCITIAANIASTGILTFDACFPDSVVGFLPNSKTNCNYIQNWISFLQKILEETAPAVAQKNINLKILRALDVPLPPLALQEEFASIVEKTEKIKAQMQQSLSELEDNFNCLSQKAFKGEL